MYQVSNDYIAAISSSLRELKGKVNINVDILTEELQSIKLSYTSNNKNSIIGNVISCSADVVLNNKEDTISVLKGDDLSFDIGLMVNNTVEYIPFAPMFVDDIKESEIRLLTVTCFDKMQKFNSVLLNDVNIIYPITAREFLSQICSAVGLTVSTKTFYNETTVIQSKPNFTGTETLREVLSHLSAFCLGNAVINRQGEVEIISIKALDQPVTTITPNEYMSLSVKEVYGQINTVVLSRTPQEDNEYRSDETAVSLNGVKELRIENNAFYYFDRDLYIDDLFEKLNGFFYFPVELDWRGNPALEYGDRITIVNTDGSTIETYILAQTFEFDGGFKAKMHVESPIESSTNYKRASNLKERLKNTEIIVDKANNDIKSIVENTYTKDEIQSTLSTKLTQTSNSFEFLVQEAIRNSEETTTQQIDELRNSDTLLNTVVTIDNDGIKVGKSTSEFESTMSDTGLYLSSRGNDVASFSPQGVHTTNLYVYNELECGFLKIMKVNDTGEKRCHIHFTG